MLPSGLKPVTDRQKEVIKLIALGKCSKEIATALSINENTVKFHKTHIFKKYKVKSVTELFGKLLEEKEAEIKRLKDNYEK